MNMREQHKEKLEAAFSSMLEAAFETFDGEPKQEGLVIMAIFDLFEATCIDRNKWFFRYQRRK